MTRLAAAVLSASAFLSPIVFRNPTMIYITIINERKIEMVERANSVTA